MSDSCANCIAFLLTDAPFGECRRHPPLSVEGRSWRPKLPSWDWCGDHMAMPVAQAVEATPEEPEPLPEPEPPVVLHPAAHKPKKKKRA